MDEKERNRIAEKLVSFRQARSMSADQLAKLCKVSTRTVRRWEKGETLPTIDNIMILCNNCGLSIDEFMNSSTYSMESKNIETVHISEEAITSEKSQNRRTMSTTDAILSILVIHALTAAILFVCSKTGVIHDIGQVIFALVYTIATSAIIWTSRRNRSAQLFILLYASALLCFICFYLFTPAIKEKYILYDPLIMAMVGPTVYLTSFAVMYLPELYLSVSCVIYTLWIISSLTFLCHEYLLKKGQKAVSHSSVLFIILSLMCMLSICLLPVAEFRYFVSPMFYTVHSRLPKLGNFLLLGLCLFMVFAERWLENKEGLRRWMHYLYSLIFVFFAEPYLTHFDGSLAGEYGKYWIILPGRYLIYIWPIGITLVQLVQDLKTYIQKKKEKNMVY